MTDQDPPPKRARDRHRQERRDAQLEVFDEFVPAILEHLRSQAELVPKVVSAIDEILSEGVNSENAKRLKVLTPLLQACQASNEKLLNRAPSVGKPVERSVAKVDSSLQIQQTIVHTSLGELLQRRREALGAARRLPEIEVPTSEVEVVADE